MPITAEERTLRSLRMKESWQKRKAAAGEVPTDPAIREAMAKVPMNSPAEPPKIHFVGTEPVSPLTGSPAENWTDHLPSHIDIEVDWEHLPMQEAQQFYAHLKSEFERAGRILNARSMERTSGYTCFMCKKHFDGNPGFTDHSYVDPKTGLSPRVDCCGELCVINYNAMRINERHQRSMARAQQERNG
jgi:hypothetical protein